MGINNMKKDVTDRELTILDDAFEVLRGFGAEVCAEEVIEVELAKLPPFQGHPFQVLDDEKMWRTVESVKENGILVPVIVRSLDDDEAVLIMVDSNIQRENLLPSERAWAYRLKLEAIKRKAGRPKEDNSVQVVQDFKGKTPVEIVAEDCGKNYKQVQRYIRLTELCPALLQMTDDKKIPFSVAVELSFLSLDEQQMLLAHLEESVGVPSLEQARLMKECSRERDLTDAAMDLIMAEKRAAIEQVTLNKGKLPKYFHKEYTQKQMEEVIISLLEEWKKEQGK